MACTCMYPGHHFNNLSIKLGITSISALKEAVDHTTLDTAALRIKFAEQLRLVEGVETRLQGDKLLLTLAKAVPMRWLQIIRS